MNYKKLYEGEFLINKKRSISQSHSDIYNLILKKQGDGLDINVNLTSETCLMDISLIDNDDYKYIVKYFRSKFTEATEFYVEKDIEVEGYQNGFVAINHFDSSIEEDINSIIEELKEHGIEAELLNLNEKSHECGAGAFFTAAILAIVSATTGVTVNKAIEAVNEKWRNKRKLIISYYMANMMLRSYILVWQEYIRIIRSKNVR